MKSLEDLRDIGTNREARDWSACAFFLMKAGEAGLSAAAAQAQRTHPRAAAILKAAVPGGGMDFPEWAGSIVEAEGAIQAWLGTLRSQGVFDGMLPNMVNLPAHAGVRVQTSVQVGATVAEGFAAPIFRLSFAEPILGELFSSSAIVVLSNSVLDQTPSGGISLIERELRRAAIAAVDASFLTLLTAGVSPVASTGSTAAAIRGDIAAALDRMELDASSRVFLIGSTSLIRRLGMLGDGQGAKAFAGLTIRGGSLDGITVLASDTITAVGSPASSMLYLVDASRVAAYDAGMGIDTASHASIVMDDAPVMSVGGVGSPDTPVAAQMVSMFQTNCKALRAQRWWSARRLTDSSVAAISGIA